MELSALPASILGANNKWVKIYNWAFEKGSDSLEAENEERLSSKFVRRFCIKPLVISVLVNLGLGF